MKLLKRTVITGIALLILLASCSSEKVNIKPEIKHENISHIEDTNYEYKVSTENLFNPEEILCDRLVDRYNEGYVFTGSAYCVNPELIAVSGAPDTETEKNSFDHKGSINNCISVKKKDDNTYFLCGKDGKGSLTAFDKTGTQLGRLELEYYPAAFDVGDNIYVIESGKNIIRAYTQDLEFLENYDSGYSSEGANTFPEMIAVSPENEIYCVISEKYNKDSEKIVRIGASNKIICESIDDLDYISNIFTNSRGNIVLTENKDGNCLVDILDRDGNIINMTEIRNCDEVYGVTDSDKIIFSNSEGIYSFSENSTELLAASGEYDGKSIYACCTDGEGYTAYLSSDYENINAVFIADKNNSIISELRADSIDDCFVQEDNVYVSGSFDGVRTVKIFNPDKITDTGIILDDNRGVYSIGVLASGDILVGNPEKENIDVYSDTFEYKSSVNTNIKLCGIFKSSNALYCYEHDSACIYRINDDYKTEKIDIGLNEYAGSISYSSGNDEYDFLYSVPKGIFGFCSSENTITLMLDFNREAVSKPDSFLITEDKRILFEQFPNVSEAKLTEKNQNISAEKEKLTLAFYDINNDETDSLRKAVKKYNDTSDKYFIEMKGYISNEYVSAESTLALDIISGRIPDIVSTDLLSEKLVSLLKDNALADLYPYLENDEELNKEMFYLSILDAFTYRGKLYTLPLTVGIYSGLTTDGTSADNCSQLIDILSSKYDSEDNYINYGRELTGVYLSEKTDFETGKFNVSESDINTLISFLRRYDHCLDENDMENFDFSAVRAIGEEHSFYSLRAYSYYKINLSKTFPDAPDNAGFPKINGLVHPGISFSVMESCDNKDAAWEFIKTCSKNLKHDTEETLYSVKELNKISDLESDIKEDFDLFMEGKFINNRLFNSEKLGGMIYNELYTNPDLSDEELSKSVYNKMKLYFEEIK